MSEVNFVRVMTGGCIAMCSYPKTNQDLDRLRDWGAAGLLSLVGEAELERLGLSDLEFRLQLRDMWWRHAPIVDLSVPGPAFEIQWSKLSPWLHEQLAEEVYFAVHCWAGLGRTGLIVARLLVEAGHSAPEAVHLVRSARPGTIETTRQLEFVARCAERQR